MKAIHKKIIAAQAKAMRRSVTSWAPTSRHQYVRDTLASKPDPDFINIIKHNNKWFCSVVAQVLAAPDSRKAALLRILLVDRGISPNWSVTDWAMCYNERAAMAEFFKHKVTKLPLQN